MIDIRPGDLVVVVANECNCPGYVSRIGKIFKVDDLERFPFGVSCTYCNTDFGIRDCAKSSTITDMDSMLISCLKKIEPLKDDEKINEILEIFA